MAFHHPPFLVLMVYYILPGFFDFYFWLSFSVYFFNLNQQDQSSLRQEQLQK